MEFIAAKGQFFQCLAFFVWVPGCWLPGLVLAPESSQNPNINCSLSSANSSHQGSLGDGTVYPAVQLSITRCQHRAKISHCVQRWFKYVPQNRARHGIVAIANTLHGKYVYFSPSPRFPVNASRFQTMQCISLSHYNPQSTPAYMYNWPLGSSYQLSALDTSSAPLVRETLVCRPLAPSGHSWKHNNQHAVITFFSYKRERHWWYTEKTKNTFIAYSMKTKVHLNQTSSLLQPGGVQHVNFAHTPCFQSDTI